MKVNFTIFLLKIILTLIEAADNSTSEEFYNPYEDEHSLFLWKNLFIKVNTLLVETNKVNDNLLNIDKKQHEQEMQSNDMLQQIQVMNAANNKFYTEFKNVLQEQGNQLKKIVEHTKEVDVVNRFNMIANDRWTTILRRMDGTVDFYKNWTEYKSGFGNPPSGEFFIGLEKLHLLTTAVPVVELKILLKTWDNEERYAIYDGFQIGNETEKYRIKLLGKYSGNAGDAIRPHVGHNFTTFDEDNDTDGGGNCAKDFKGAWWFHGCYNSHLFGPYRQLANAYKGGIGWVNFAWKGNLYSFQYAEMLLRPKL
ncbi:ryncolin-1-like [Musca autumnalis]|uniref:ryncolin-1-like n=1 Tax=Musca autumnalis TaxID=221902 RepID=UPI003CF02110